jgi:hypothetical protein
MERGTARFPVLLGLAVGSIGGALIRIGTPDSWWNLAFMPWYAIPVALPSFFLLVVTALVLRIDVLSDAASEVLVNALWVMTTAVVIGSYGAAVGRFWARHRSVR